MFAIISLRRDHRSNRRKPVVVIVTFAASLFKSHKQHHHRDHHSQTILVVISIIQCASLIFCTQSFTHKSNVNEQTLCDVYVWYHQVIVIFVANGHLVNIGDGAEWWREP
jgi:hypothetical protein